MTKVRQLFKHDLPERSEPNALSVLKEIAGQGASVSEFLTVFHAVWKNIDCDHEYDYSHVA